MRRRFIFFFIGVASLAAVRPVPPPGIAISAEDQSQLHAGLERLHKTIESLGANTLLPDVVIYEKAVRYALDYGEFFKPEEVGRAKGLLAEGQARADALLRGPLGRSRPG